MCIERVQIQRTSWFSHQTHYPGNIIHSFFRTKTKLNHIIFFSHDALLKKKIFFLFVPIQIASLQLCCWKCAQHLAGMQRKPNCIISHKTNWCRIISQQTVDTETARLWKYYTEAHSERTISNATRHEWKRPARWFHSMLTRNMILGIQCGVCSKFECFRVCRSTLDEHWMNFTLTQNASFLFPIHSRTRFLSPPSQFSWNWRNVTERVLRTTTPVGHRVHCRMHSTHNPTAHTCTTIVP